ncbi:MAG: ribosomal protein L7/L12 [Phycisphaerales bacterium]|nr:MAG: ribosomal protein L7/L12 [Phycisphaerales bacterium]
MSYDSYSLDDGLCPQCSAQADYFEEGLTCGWKCPACDWGVAATNPNDPAFDSTQYDVWVESRGQERKKVIATVAALMALNIKEARSLIDSGAAVAESLSRHEVLDLHAKLEAKDLGIRVEPEFPWLADATSSAD